MIAQIVNAQNMTENLTVNVYKNNTNTNESGTISSLPVPIRPPFPVFE